MKRQTKKQQRYTTRDRMLEASLAVFIEAGTLDLSLDRLAATIESSKRMLIHYFGGKKPLERAVMVRLEESLRAQFRADSFPPGTSLPEVLATLWQRTTHPKARGVLLLTMDLTRRAWSGSKRAKEFYEKQWRIWINLLLEFSPDGTLVESALQLFQGAMLTYLVTGDRENGRRTLERFFLNSGSTNRGSNDQTS